LPHPDINIINSAGVDHTPFIAPDERYLIFVSRGRSALSRDFQFYLSYKNEDDSWQEPIDLGEKIKALGSGLCPAVTPDGKYMFFIGRGDIYWIDAGFIENLRPKQ
jgi:Tol biopolymer transport system component